MRSLSLLHLPIECITSYQFVTRYRERTELRKERREGEGRFAKKVRLQLLFRRNANACGATRNEERRTNGGERKGRGKEPEERRPTDRHANVVLQQDNDTLPRGDNIYSSHKTAHYAFVCLFIQELRRRDWRYVRGSRRSQQKLCRQTKAVLPSFSTALRIPSCATFCWMCFGNSPWLVGRYCSYLLSKQALTTHKENITKYVEREDAQRCTSHDLVSPTICHDSRVTFP